MEIFVETRFWVLGVTAIFLSIFCCNTGKAQNMPETGMGGGDPAQIVAKALLCFNDRSIYSNCAEAYRLNMNGNLNVPYDYTDVFCTGPCLAETQLMLNCIDNIMSNFVFYNKATVQDVRDTVQAGCGLGPERGNFNVAGRMQTEASNAHKVANWVSLGIPLMVFGHELLL